MSHSGENLSNKFVQKLSKFVYHGDIFCPKINYFYVAILGLYMRSTGFVYKKLAFFLAKYILKEYKFCVQLIYKDRLDLGSGRWYKIAKN